MKRRDLLVAGLIVLVLAVIFLRSRADNTPELPQEVPIENSDIENSLEETLGRVISEDAEKTNLEDLTNSGFIAIATRAQEQGIVEFTVLADVDEPEEGSYQVLAGANAESLKPLGNLVPAKGGYLFEYRQAATLEDFNNVLVKLGDRSILQGSF